jgi:hypothetical protein
MQWARKVQKKSAIRDMLWTKECKRTEGLKTCSTGSKEQYEDQDVLRTEASHQSFVTQAFWIIKSLKLYPVMLINIIN